MNNELDDKLTKDFPMLYRQRHLPMTQTCMCWGFEVGDGWEPLIRELSEQITKLDATVQATQVKEKFGGLRFYINHATDEIGSLISIAESKSYYICENCGKPGTLRTDGWYVTACDECVK